MRIKIENGQLKIRVQNSKDNLKQNFSIKSLLNFIFDYVPMRLVVLLVPILLFTLANNNTNQNDVFYVYLLILGFSTTLFFAQIFIGKKRIFFDPNGLTGVLIFNLVLTATVILNTSNKISSTFATTFFRSGSGIALISFIALFYLLYYFTLKFTSLFENRTFRYGTLFAYSIFLLDLALDQRPIPQIDFLFIVSFAVLIYVLFRNSFNKLPVKIFAAVTIFIMYAKISASASQIKYGNFIIALAFAYLFTTLVFFLQRRKNIVSVCKYYLSRIKFKYKNKTSAKFSKEGTQEFYRFLARLTTPFIVILIVFVSFLRDNLIFKNFFAEFTRFLNQFNILVDGNLTGETIQYLLIGKGTDFILQSNSFASNILMASGLIGFLGYFVMWMINIVLSAKMYRRSKSTLNFFKLFFTTLFIVVAFLVNTPLLMVVVWWIIFVDNAVKVSRSNPNLNVNEPYRFINLPKIRNSKVNKVVNVFLLGIFLTMCLILISFVTRNIV